MQKKEKKASFGIFYRLIVDKINKKGNILYKITLVCLIIYVSMGLNIRYKKI